MRKPFLRTVGALAAAALSLAGMVLAAPPAAAGHLKCGDTVTVSTTLDNDLGPCPGDGLIITGAGITLDLGGHTVTGNNSANRTAAEQVGVHLIGATNSTVRNGIVRNFDAGVAVEGGGSNTVTGLRVQDNINHATAAGVRNPCNYGDGIAVIDSANNTIRGNQAVHNGPYSGISLVGNSDNNRVTGNQAVDQTVSNLNPAFVDNTLDPQGQPRNPEGLGPCGPFAEDSPVGRAHQDIGIRIEGPGADNNVVEANQAARNQLEGISIHGFICRPPGPPRPPQPNNGGNLITQNQVTGNGFAGPDELQDGIAVLQQGPLGPITCAAFGNTITSNTSTGNARHGIFVSALSYNNTIDANVVRDNGTDGIRLNGPFTRGGVTYPGAHDNTLTGNQGSANREHDGHDANASCDSNRWVRNTFGTVNQACVAANGGSGTVKP